MFSFFNKISGLLGLIAFLVLILFLSQCARYNYPVSTTFDIELSRNQAHVTVILQDTNAFTDAITVECNGNTVYYKVNSHDHTFKSSFYRDTALDISISCFKKGDLIYKNHHYVQLQK